MLTVLLLSTAMAAPKCATTTQLSGTSGTFTDGSGVKALYAAKQRACWQLADVCDEGERLQLWFTRMDVELEYDFVRVYGATGALVEADADVGDAFYDSAFTVLFSTDADVELRGFTGHWSCEAAAPPSEDDEVTEHDKLEAEAAWAR